MVTQQVIFNVIQLLDEAHVKHQSILPLTIQEPTMTFDDAYAIQVKRIKIATMLGDRITGKKNGLTSFAMQNLLGVDQPDYGHL